MITSKQAGVFPTHVGVYRNTRPVSARIPCFPHACGGVPPPLDACLPASPFSPRTWGCTWMMRNSSANTRVFPTHVGVYRRVRRLNSDSARFPHARGGVPDNSCWFSPTGFVFPTHVGVYRYSCRNVISGMSFSPRTWGCTFPFGRLPQHQVVFPTHVGVYRDKSSTTRRHNSFSPRMWGCT